MTFTPNVDDLGDSNILGHMNGLDRTAERNLSKVSSRHIRIKSIEL